jgi:OOP family OmpA-OmpF porin
MNSNAYLKIAIEGNTDNPASCEHNKSLSTNRANTILKSFTSRGIASGRPTAAGFSAERLLVANDSELNMAKSGELNL